MVARRPYGIMYAYMLVWGSYERCDAFDVARCRTFLPRPKFFSAVDADMLHRSATALPHGACAGAAAIRASIATS